MRSLDAVISRLMLSAATRCALRKVNVKSRCWMWVIILPHRDKKSSSFWKKSKWKRRHPVKEDFAGGPLRKVR
jgi:hypothetical protein